MPRKKEKKMASSFYYIEVAKRDFKKRAEPEILKFNSKAETESDRLPPSEEYNFFVSHTCREFVMNDFERFWTRLFPKIHPESMKYLTGIRCFGEQHTKVSRVLQKYSDKYGDEVIRNLEKFLNEIFTVNISIGFGRTSEGTKDNPFSGIKVEYMSPDRKSKEYADRLGYVDVYMKSEENVGVPRKCSLDISTILWILREPVICEEILRGGVETVKDLVILVADLAEKRSRWEDKSYVVISSVMNYPMLTEKQIVAKLGEGQYFLNSDGWDYTSMVMVSLYIFAINSTKNLFEAGRNANGPVTQVRNYLKCRQAKELLQKENPEALEKISQALLAVPVDRLYSLKDKDFVSIFTQGEE